MSDGGYDIDQQIKKKQGKTTLRSPVFNKRTGNLVSYPDIPIGDEISRFKEDGDLISRSIENNSLAKDGISNKSPLDQDKLRDNLANKPPLDQNKFSIKPPSFKKNSFSERLKVGWTKEQLMKHYSMSEEEYEKTIVSIKNIHK